MDEKPYKTPQGKPAKCRPFFGQYLLLAFIVVPIVIYAGWMAYRIAIYGLSAALH